MAGSAVVHVEAPPAAPDTGYDFVCGSLDAEDYFDLPQDGNRYELIEGDLFVVPPPYSDHQYLSAELHFTLMTHVRRLGLGNVFASPIGVQLDARTVVEPDIVYIPKNHPQSGQNVGAFTHPPLLVVELISPSSSRHDRKLKFSLYERSGIQNYWIADPMDRSLTAWTLRDGAYVRIARGVAGESTFAAPPFPDLSIDCALLFPVR